LRVEEDKSAEQRGYYRHPEMFGEGPNASIFWAGNPDLMARLGALWVPGMSAAWWAIRVFDRLRHVPARPLAR
jgi:hypothetical protein